MRLILFSCVIDHLAIFCEVSALICVFSSGIQVIFHVYVLGIFSPSLWPFCNFVISKMLYKLNQAVGNLLELAFWFSIIFWRFIQVVLCIGNCFFQFLAIMSKAAINIKVFV